MKQRTINLIRMTAAVCLGAAAHAHAAPDAANTNSAVGGVSVDRALVVEEDGALRNAGFGRFRAPFAATNQLTRIPPQAGTNAIGRANALLRRARAEAEAKAGGFGLKAAPLQPASRFLQPPTATDAPRTTETNASVATSNRADGLKLPAKTRTPSMWWYLRDRPFSLRPDAANTNNIPSAPPSGLLVPPPIVPSTAFGSTSAPAWSPPAFVRTPAARPIARLTAPPAASSGGKSPDALLVPSDLKLEGPSQSGNTNALRQPASGGIQATEPARSPVAEKAVRAPVREQSRSPDPKTTGREPVRGTAGLRAATLPDDFSGKPQAHPASQRLVEKPSQQSRPSPATAATRAAQRQETLDARPPSIPALGSNTALALLPPPFVQTPAGFEGTRATAAVDSARSSPPATPTSSAPSTALGSNAASALLPPPFVQTPAGFEGTRAAAPPSQPRRSETIAGLTNITAQPSPPKAPSPPPPLAPSSVPGSNAPPAWLTSAFPPAPAAAEPARPASATTNTTTRSTASKTLRELPADLRPLVDDAHQLFSQKKFDEAAAKYREILKRDPENLFGLSNLAVIRFQQEQLDEAEHLLNRALQVAPNDAYCRATIGIIYFKQNRIDDAIEELTRSLKLDPSNAEAHNYLGIACWRKGWSSAAEQELHRALEIRPDYLDAHHNLVLIYTSPKLPFPGLAKFHYRKTLELGRARDPELEKLLADGKTRKQPGPGALPALPTP